VKGEKLTDVIEVKGNSDEWPTYYVRTSVGVYEYTGQSFVARASAPEGRSVDGLSEALNKSICEVRGDGESAVILLDSMDLVVFSIRHDPFGSEVRSWPNVSFCSAADSLPWRDEYNQMGLLE
jgi:hypothetical protein